MSQRRLVSNEMAKLLGVLSHPNRVQIVEELREGERDVNALQKALGISHSGVSQHLALLRAHHLVAERREGRHVFYRLCQMALAIWLIDGLQFIDPSNDAAQQLHSAVEHVRGLWSQVTDHVAQAPEQVAQATAHITQPTESIAQATEQVTKEEST
jgi:DNA-binding transcriptional ArsR family regulator